MGKGFQAHERKTEVKRHGVKDQRIIHIESKDGRSKIDFVVRNQKEAIRQIREFTDD